ncbi:family 43 glycosylhydrolase [Hymenobacter cavernae]|uniref:family 43 glycosylhydrolase n=1 Tax=Hymenobacter cavernae TaxID=2044852 RepID=UPI001E3AE750|nr:family 43 glycosylhydrolase [Hymenobacter cavernae]
MSFDLEAGAAFAPALFDLSSECQGQAPIDSSAVVSVAPPVSAKPRTTYANVVLPGDFPDPTITKIGDTYWASATSAEWGPVFPLFKSTNLVDWELVSHVFMDKPEWAEASFWAPEISHEDGKTYICYTARKKGGPLCVAIASADDPAGPYVDHGPLVGQRRGSIDGFPLRDENGVLYLVWKEDGNAYGKPTPIWAQRMNEQRTKLIGKKHELFRNDAPWEGNLVEGSAFVEHGGYFYMFYAGNGCCGSGCTYATGVARAQSLLGPWEKCPQNPILKKNKTWSCPGHGTVAEYEGRWFLLHHAYHASSHEFVGRQGILSEFTWNEEGWPEFEGNSPQAAPLHNVGMMNLTDHFAGNQLAGTWHWPIGKRPVVGVSDGQLLLNACPEQLGSLVAQRTYAATYKATTSLNAAALPAGTFAGLTAVGDPDNALALMAGDGKLQLWYVKKGKTQCLTEVSVELSRNLGLRVEAWGGQRYRFSYSTNGVTWEAMPMDTFAVNGTYLPPWDRGIRVGLLAQGPEDITVAFDSFTIRNQR